MSVTSNLQSKFLFLLYFAIFFNFLPHFLAKNSKYKMLSTHILKSTLLSCNSTHQTALNKECPQSSQFRNWPAHYNQGGGGSGFLPGVQFFFSFRIKVNFFFITNPSIVLLYDRTRMILWFCERRVSIRVCL